MNKTHGDILHSPITTNGPVLNDLVYRQRLEDTTTGGITPNGTIGNYNPPRGEVGWICPVCGRGLAPSTSYCPCNLTRNITYINGSPAIKDVMDTSIDTNTTPPEAYDTTIAISNYKDAAIYGTHCNKHPL